jgi:hypothetical protein
MFVKSCRHYLNEESLFLNRERYIYVVNFNTLMREKNDQAMDDLYFGRLLDNCEKHVDRES